MNKLAIEYQIDTFKTPSISLPADFIALASNSNPNVNSPLNQSLRQKYRKKIDSICYSANITRPNVVKAASKLAEYLINSSLEHLHATNHCLQYLHKIKHLVIRYSPSRGDELIVQFPNNESLDSAKHVFENTIDVSFVNDLEKRSYEDIIFKLYDKMIDWVARKQITVSTSITEVELLTLLHASKICIWWANFFNKLEFDHDHEIKILNDNVQTIRILIFEQLKITIKLLHLNIAQLWLRQSVQLDRLHVNYLQTNEMTTDDLIKSLPP